MEIEENKKNLKIILDDSSNLSLNQIRRLLNEMSPSEIAHALESSPPKQRNILFSLLETEEEGDVLFELGEEVNKQPLRDYGVGAQILADLGVKNMILLSNSDRTIVGLDGHGLSVVDRIAINLWKQNQKF